MQIGLLLLSTLLLVGLLFVSAFAGLVSLPRWRQGFDSYGSALRGGVLGVVVTLLLLGVALGTGVRVEALFGDLLQALGIATLLGGALGSLCGAVRHGKRHAAALQDKDSAAA